MLISVTSSLVPFKQAPTSKVAFRRSVRFQLNAGVPVSPFHEHCHSATVINATSTATALRHMPTPNIKIHMRVLQSSLLLRRMLQATHTLSPSLHCRVCSLSYYCLPLLETCSPGSMGAPDAGATSTASESRLHGTHVHLHHHARLCMPKTPRPTLKPAPIPKPNLNPDSPLPPDPQPPRSLTTLRWPYVPDTSAYPDPLTRDDPKPLQMNQYERLLQRSERSSPTLVYALLLTTIDAQRGAEREEALQRALGVNSRLLKNDDVGVELDEDTNVLRAFAEAIEEAVRGGQEDVLGLDWD
ncbi:hypothetical protein JVT61DRAFT_14502 [Boletus reticuloceps]|uniref:Uncharacterized protein n=1 Tax=Boletus reticuloceps TaxID=495285 RepID=A0A8I2YT96_9AGAM|nr:hypothetical protein JVT61DRAFT_14502 [Boletus reticuloceps]